MTTSAHLHAEIYPPIGSRPTITLKWASTLDGRIATVDGDSKWITGERAREGAHRLRSAHDAILVGINTVLEDDPELTVRLVPGTNPTRIVLDSRLRMPRNARLLSAPGRVIIATTRRARSRSLNDLKQSGVKILRVGEDDNRRVDLLELMNRLPSLGVRSLLVEGGAGTLTSFLRLRLADRLVVFLAPRIIGDGIDAVGELEVEEIAAGIRVHEPSYETLGEDIMIAGTPVWPSE